MTNIGRIDDDNEKFLQKYKQLGYTTQTQMINAAIRALKRQRSREERAAWRNAGHCEYADSQPEKMWSDLDGEDFREV